jgi:hypothetical protein
VYLGNIPWSPKLQWCDDKIELMKMIIRKRKGVRTSMTKTWHQTQITGAWNVLEAASNNL